MRTLAVAFRPLQADEVNQPSPLLERDLVLAGIVGIIDPPRPEALAAVPGIVAQLVLIPLLLTALQKAGFAD